MAAAPDTMSIAAPSGAGPGIGRLAIVLPATAMALGAAAPSWGPARRIVQGVALSAPLIAVALARAARGDRSMSQGSPQAVPPRTGAAAEELPAAAKEPPAAAKGPPAATGPRAVTVLIPARDEAAVVGALIGDLGRAFRLDADRLAATGGSGRLSLVVIDDASTDGTAAAAEAALASAGLGSVGRVIRVPVPSRSKGRALAAVPVSSSPDELIVVLDADARIDPGFVGRCRAVLTCGGEVAQARRRMLAPRRPTRLAHLLARLQDDELALDDVIQRGRLALGGTAELRGDGMLVRADALAGVGGWPVDALCEDLELSTRWYLASGHAVARPAGLDVREQPVLEVRALLTQRLRWAEGAIRRDLRISLPAVVDGTVPARRRLEVGAYAAEALVPWVAIGLAARAGLSGREQGRRGALRGLLALALCYAAGTTMLAWEATAPNESPEMPDESPEMPNESPEMPDESPAPAVDAAGAREVGLSGGSGKPAGRLARALAVAAFAVLWPCLLPIAWLRVVRRPGSSLFARTSHAAAGDFIEPAPAPTPRT